MMLVASLLGYGGTPETQCQVKTTSVARIHEKNTPATQNNIFLAYKETPTSAFVDMVATRLGKASSGENSDLTSLLCYGVARLRKNSK
jgi:hypothetical protein